MSCVYFLSFQISPIFIDIHKENHESIHEHIYKTAEWNNRL